MKQLCKLALIQMDCTLGDVPANLEHALELGRKAVAQGANLLVFPELFTTGYELSVLGADLCSYAEDPSDSPTLNKMRDFPAFILIQKESFWASMIKITYSEKKRTISPLESPIRFWIRNLAGSVS